MTDSHTFAVCTSITEVATRGKGSHVCPRPAAPSTHAHARPARARTLAHTHVHTQTRLRGGRPGEAGITSPRPPLCNNRGRYHQRGQGRGTSAASLWRTRGRWSRIPSSLSSFSVFGLQDPLVTEESGPSGGGRRGEKNKAKLSGQPRTVPGRGGGWAAAGEGRGPRNAGVRPPHTG